MAQNEIIEWLNNFGIRSTVGLPTGGWEHTEEYNRLRNQGIKGLKRLLKERSEQGSAQAAIQLALLTSKRNDNVQGILGDQT